MRYWWLGGRAKRYLTVATVCSGWGLTSVAKLARTLDLVLLDEGLKFQINIARVKMAAAVL